MKAKKIWKNIGISTLFLHVSNTSKASSKSPEEHLHQATEMADTAVQPRELECCKHLQPAVTGVAQNVMDESKAFSESHHWTHWANDSTFVKCLSKTNTWQ